MSELVVFHGTPAERDELLSALSHHCACHYDRTGARLQTCEVHEQISTDQKLVDRLVFARRLRAQLLAEELSEDRPL